MLQQLLSSHMHNRLLLPGSLVLLPVLGQRLVLQVTTVGDALDGVPVLVHAATRMQLGAAHASDDATTLVRRAADAAAAAVGGGLEGAAARTAAAAFTAGAALLRASASQTTPFGDVAGMATQLAMLQRLVVQPLKDPSTTRALGVGTPCGVLLHGPPGTGKSLLCRAAAAAANASLFVLHGPDALSGVLGDSEAGVCGAWRCLSKPVSIGQRWSTKEC